jgi:hypothetical protein
MNFAAITLCVASQRVISKVSVYFVMTRSGNFWIHCRVMATFGRKKNPTDMGFEKRPLGL